MSAKRKGEKETRTHIALLFEFRRLKIGCFKTAVLKTRDHATDVVPRLVTSSSLCPGSVSRHVPWGGGRRIKIAVTQMMKRFYHKQCISQHHDINDRT